MHKQAIINSLAKYAGVGATVFGGGVGTGLGYLAGRNTSNFFNLDPKSYKSRLLRLGGALTGGAAGAYTANSESLRNLLGGTINVGGKLLYGAGIAAAVPLLGYAAYKNFTEKPSIDIADPDITNPYRGDIDKWKARVADAKRRGDLAEHAATKKNMELACKAYDDLVRANTEKADAAYRQYTWLPDSDNPLELLWYMYQSSKSYKGLQHADLRKDKALRYLYPMDYEDESSLPRWKKSINTHRRVKDSIL